MNVHTGKSYGWYGTIQQFLLCSRSEWLNVLQNYHHKYMNRPVDEPLHAALEHAFEILQKELKQLVQLKPDLGNYSIVFEYGLPAKPERRQDVIILGASIFILEFSDYAQIIRADVDEVDASRRDLEQYHPASRQSEVVPVLILAHAKDVIRRDGEVIILSPDHIADYFNVQAELEEVPVIDASTWLRAG
jgi:hypothetical protein